MQTHVKIGKNLREECDRARTQREGMRPGRHLLWRDRVLRERRRHELSLGDALVPAGAVKPGKSVRESRSCVQPRGPDDGDASSSSCSAMPALCQRCYVVTAEEAVNVAAIAVYDAI